MGSTSGTGDSGMRRKTTTSTSKSPAAQPKSSTGKTAPHGVQPTAASFKPTSQQSDRFETTAWSQREGNLMGSPGGVSLSKDEKKTTDSKQNTVPQKTDTPKTGKEWLNYLKDKLPKTGKEWLDYLRKGVDKIQKRLGADDGKGRTPAQPEPSSCWARAALAAAHTVGDITKKLKDLHKYVPKNMRHKMFGSGGTEYDEKRMIERMGMKGIIKFRPSKKDILKALKDPKVSGVVFNVPGHAMAFKPTADGKHLIWRDSGRGITRKLPATVAGLSRFNIHSIVISKKINDDVS